jgi:hypothetical protein
LFVALSIAAEASGQLRPITSVMVAEYRSSYLGAKLAVSPLRSGDSVAFCPPARSRISASA